MSNFWPAIKQLKQPTKIETVDTCTSTYSSRVSSEYLGLDLVEKLWKQRRLEENTIHRQWTESRVE